MPLADAIARAKKRPGVLGQEPSGQSVSEVFSRENNGNVAADG